MQSLYWVQPVHSFYPACSPGEGSREPLRCRAAIFLWINYWSIKRARTNRWPKKKAQKDLTYKGQRHSKTEQESANQDKLRLATFAFASGFETKIS